MPVVRYTTINGEIVAEKRNGVRSLYVPDALGSTVALLDNTQTKTDTFASWPYGETVHLTGTNPTPFTFVGTQGYHADNSARTYVRARVIESPKARWLTEDPISFELGGLNLYQYVNCSPTNDYDYSGLAKGGKQHKGGNDPRYRLSCAKLWELYAKARGAEKAEINTILKLNRCKGSGGKKGQAKGQTQPCNPAQPAPAPKPSRSPFQEHDPSSNCIIMSEPYYAPPPGAGIVIGKVFVCAVCFGVVVGGALTLDPVQFGAGIKCYQVVLGN